MEDLPSNSQRRVSSDGESSNRGSTESKNRDERKVERVTSEAATRRKRPLGKRFKETFVKDDAGSVWSYVMLDVLIPAAKDMVSDAVSEGIERMLFGDSIRGRRRSSRGSSSNGYVSYNRVSSSSSRAPWQREDPRNDPRDQRRSVSKRARSTHNFDEIVLKTRPDAEEVIDRLFDLVDRYDRATVSDLYDLTGITGNYTDDKWGWTDLRGAGVSRVREGYLLDLPRPEPLDN